MTRKSTYVIGALLCLLVSANAFAQGTVNATVGGTVADASGALIPGVTVTATNVGTNIANSVVTNESGAYNFASLQPGAYKISAELPGFQTQVFTDVQLGGAQQVRLNFNLQVAAAAGTSVEVTVSADTLLATSSNSIGTVLPDFKIRELPTQAANVFNLVQNMPGVQRNAGGTFGFMAGGRLGDVNATRDGVNVNDGRYENGAWSVVYTPPEMVEEVKVIVAPIDAETSRGNGQVQLVSRSGTNQYRGTVSWSNHNSALDANSWFNNFNGAGKAYDNRNQYVASLGGPILKNKTFFFGLFTGQRDLKKNQATGTTLTDYAKAGIIRYWPGADPANANNTNPSVDRFGNPVRPANATGDLSAIGLFGTCNFKGAPVANCRVFNDPLRPTISTHPFLQEELKRMPSPNEFTGGDGLNTGTIRFTRRQEGLDLTNGNGDEVNRDSYNLKIDHNFNSRHKVSLIATKEKTWGTATQAGLRSWPDAYDGLAVKRPYLYSLQVTSTISGSLLNQVRIAKRASNNWQWGSADRGDAIGAEARKLHANANGIPYQVTFATTGINSFSNIGGFGRWREGINPMRSLGDDLSWNVGAHSFKTGFEYRRQESNGFNDPNYTPLITLGAGNNAISGLDATSGFTGLTTNAANTARSIMYDLSGSVTSYNQAFGILSAQDTVLRGTPEIRNNRHWNFQSEISSYFKDNWKFTNDLTLNLGVHWEWYGQPYEHDGLAARVVGDEAALTNVACTGSPGTIGFTSVCTNLVTVQLVGKNSTHPEVGTNLRGNDNNNFAPSFGIAWNVPWFGKGKTTIRAGYGMNYSGAARNFITVDGVIGTVPGINQVFGGGGLGFNPSAYTSLNQVSLPIPFPTGTATSAPFTVQPTQRSLGLTTYSRISPYTQNWNFELQREIARNTILEIRYIGTKGTKLESNVDVNAISYWKPNRELFEAFNAVRAGGESALLNQMFNGIGLAGTQTVGPTYTAGAALRTNTGTRAQLANGNFGGFLNTLNTTLNYNGNPSSDRGSILRRAGFPENYLVPSPQYSAVNVAGNNENSGYHALNVQVTRRLSHGFTNTTTWVWSKAFETGTTVDPNLRGTDKTLQGVDHKYQITSNGTYELPFGTGHSLLGNAPGWVQHIVGRWQLGGILNFNTGSPISITSGISTIGTAGARPIVVGAIPKNMGELKKCSTANPCYANTSQPVTSGIVFFDGFTQPVDPGLAATSPACAASTTACNGLLSGYNNRAIADPQGNIILVNPQPGQIGTLGENTLRGPNSLYFDMNLLKRFRITESKTFEFSMNAINILNHPNFAAPSSAMNTNNNFGRITASLAGADLGGNGGMRSFIINTRLNF